MITTSVWRGLSIILLWCVVVLIAGVPLAQAQTVVTATSQFAFTASADHSRTTSFGTAMVDRYDVEVYNSANVVQTTINIGKPTPAPTTNEIAVPLGSTLVNSLTKDALYTFRAVAVGPGGAGRSLPSSPFGVPNPVGLPAAPTGLRIIP